MVVECENVKLIPDWDFWLLDSLTIIMVIFLVCFCVKLRDAGKTIIWMCATMGISDLVLMAAINLNEVRIREFCGFIDNSESSKVYIYFFSGLVSTLYVACLECFWWFLAVKYWELSY